MVSNWTDEEKQSLVERYAFMLTIQRTYGQEINMKATLKGWSVVLHEYTVEQILNAMDVWMKTEPNMPVPSEIIKTIKEKPTTKKPTVEEAMAGYEF